MKEFLKMLVLRLKPEAQFFPDCYIKWASALEVTFSHLRKEHNMETLERRFLMALKQNNYASLCFRQVLTLKYCLLATGPVWARKLCKMIWPGS